MNDITPTPVAVPAVSVPVVGPAPAAPVTILAPRVAVGGLAVPDYIEDDREGLDDLAGMLRPQRLKIVQDLSEEKKSGEYAPGDVLLKPVDIKVATANSALTVRVIFSYTEFLIINSRPLIAARPDLYWLRERTLDGRSELAHKARNRVMEPAPENVIDSKTKQPAQIEYVVAINHVVWLVRDQVLALATFMKGETKYGERLGQLVAMRNKSTYAGQYDLEVAIHKNKNGDQWYGFTPKNSETPWTPQAELEQMKALRAKVKQAFDTQTLEADYEDVDSSSAATAGSFEGND